MSGLLSIVRKATRPDHERVEAVPAFKRLMAPDLTAPEYTAVLRHLHGFYAAMEPMIAAALQGHPALCLLDGTRPRALAEDLAWFGVAPVHLGVAVPKLENSAAALGALYVLEGSGLGGRIIARHVQASLGVSPGRGGSFYGGVGAEAIRARWGSLCGFLAEVEDGEGTWQVVTQAACATFQCLVSSISGASEQKASFCMAAAR